jgi:hypothetical protein
MKYYLEEVTDKGNVFYTYQILKALIAVNGHTLEERPEDADVLLISLVAIWDVSRIKKMRSRYPMAKIVAGGAMSFMIEPLTIWADAVNVGQGFEFFKLKTWDQILSAPFVYVRGKDAVYPSNYIDWQSVPLVQCAARKWYYWAGVGCKNKCSFCLTSWTNKEQRNQLERVQQAWLTLKKHDKKANLILVANETQSFDLKNKVRDYMVKDYIKPIRVPSGLVRLGIEFPSEETRRKMGKPMSEADIVTAFDLAAMRRNDLHCFYIAGLNSKDEWREHFENVLLPTSEKQPKIMIKITNLVIEPHTPLYRIRKKIDYTRLLPDTFREDLRVWCRMNNRKRFAFPIGSPRRAMADSYYTWMSTAEEYEKIRGFLKDPKGPIEPMVEWGMEAGLFDKDWPEKVKLWWRVKMEEVKAASHEA